MYQEEIAPYLATYFTSLDESKLSRVLRYAVEGGKCIRGFIVKHILEKCPKDEIKEIMMEVE